MPYAPYAGRARLNPGHPLNFGRRWMWRVVPGAAAGGNFYDLVSGTPAPLSSPAVFASAAMPRGLGSLACTSSGGAGNADASLPAFTAGNGITFAGWAYVSGTLAQRQAIISTTQISGGGLVGLVMNNATQMVVLYGGGIGNAGQAVITMPTGVWAFVCGTVVPSPKTATLYLGNAATGQLQVATGNVSSSNTSFSAGAWHLVAGNLTNCGWPGNVDAVSIWPNRVLTQAEAYQEFVLGLAGYPGVLTAPTEFWQVIQAPASGGGAAKQLLAALGCGA